MVAANNNNNNDNEQRRGPAAAQLTLEVIQMSEDIDSGLDFYKTWKAAIPRGRDLTFEYDEENDTVGMVMRRIGYAIECEIKDQPEVKATQQESRNARIEELTAQKEAAAAGEDYERAKQLKAEIEALQANGQPDALDELQERIDADDWPIIFQIDEAYHGRSQATFSEYNPDSLFKTSIQPDMIGREICLMIN